MLAQFLANLRGVLAEAGDFFSQPLVLAGVLVGIWLLWRRP